MHAPGEPRMIECCDRNEAARNLLNPFDDLDIRRLPAETFKRSPGDGTVAHPVEIRA